KFFATFVQGWAATIRYHPTVQEEFARFRKRSDTLSFELSSRHRFGSKIWPEPCWASGVHMEKDASHIATQKCWNPFVVLARSQCAMLIRTANQVWSIRGIRTDQRIRWPRFVAPTVAIWP
ncbi:unnamed protein product, partial [Nippostrongylus brasiliensis]|uniref:Cytochrome P450 n=1 Tax=Nippostrongylus brasiliensis TaxID=27835 RepID=A0A0N4YXK7_NIPBR